MDRKEFVYRVAMDTTEGQNMVKKGKKKNQNTISLCFFEYLFMWTPNHHTYSKYVEHLPSIYILPTSLEIKHILNEIVTFSTIFYVSLMLIVSRPFSTFRHCIFNSLPWLFFLSSHSAYFASLINLNASSAVYTPSLVGLVVQKTFPLTAPVQTEYGLNGTLKLSGSCINLPHQIYIKSYTFLAWGIQTFSIVLIIEEMHRKTIPMSA